MNNDNKSVTLASEIKIFTDTKKVLINGEVFPYYILATGNDLPEITITEEGGLSVVTLPVIAENVVLTTEK